MNNTSPESETAKNAETSDMRRILCKHGRRIAWFAFLFLLLISFAVAFDYESRKLPRLNGDGCEYWYQAESFHSHGSPELLPVDMQTVNDEAIGRHIWTPNPHPHAYEADLNGRMHSMHFWAYGLSAGLVQQYQVLTDRTALANLILANVCWYFLAVGVTLFGSKAPIRERLALAGCAAIGAMFWYVEWTGAELYSWSLTLIAVVAYRDHRYGLAGFSAGLAATQNPTIIYHGGVAALQSLLERKFRSAAFALIGSSIGLIPFGFCYLHFGKPSFMGEVATVGNITWVRTWSLIGDFNQGLLPYVPAVVIGMLIGLIRMMVVRNYRGLLLVAGGIAMALGTEVAHNWNSGCDGLQRYVVWMLPVVAGVAVEGIGGKWRMWLFALIATASNYAIYDAYNETEAIKGGYLSHTKFTEWILRHYPRAYWAEPEIFIERQRHADDWPRIPSEFPLAHVRDDGTVSKMILDAASVEKVAERFEVDPAFMAALRDRALRETGLFYSHPEHGAVRVRQSP